MRRHHIVGLCVGTLASITVATSARGSGLITFEGYAPPGGLLNVSPVAPYFEKGFALEPSNDQSAVFDITAEVDMPGNSDSSFFGWGEGNFVNLSTEDRSTFSLADLLLGPSTISDGPVTVTLSLFFDDGSDDTLVYENLSTATLVSPNATNLIAVVFTSSDDAAMDNLNMTVPGPAAAGLGLTAMGFGAARRRGHRC